MLRPSMRPSMRPSLATATAGYKASEVPGPGACGHLDIDAMVSTLDPVQGGLGMASIDGRFNYLRNLVAVG